MPNKLIIEILSISFPFFDCFPSFTIYISQRWLADRNKSHI